MARPGLVRRVNDADISTAPRATKDIYIDAVDGNGRAIGYGQTLVARKGQPVPAHLADHPDVRGSVEADTQLEAGDEQLTAEGDGEAGVQTPAISTLNKAELIELAEARGHELDGGETVADLRELLKDDADGDS